MKAGFPGTARQLVTWTSISSQLCELPVLNCLPEMAYFRSFPISRVVAASRYTQSKRMHCTVALQQTLFLLTAWGRKRPAAARHLRRSQQQACGRGFAQQAKCSCKQSGTRPLKLQLSDHASANLFIILHWGVYCHPRFIVKLVFRDFDS